ncbi:MAG: hypothetical protein ABIT96_11830, partial [Ferruginibacter sp.]
MAHIMHSFSLTLLHSTWQALLLFILYKAFVTILPLSFPRARKQLLYIILLGQSVASLFTFSVLYFSPSFALDTTYLLAQIIPVKYFIPAYVVNTCMWIYLLSVSVKCLQLFIQWRNFQHSLQGTLQKAPAEIRLFAASMADSFGIKRNIKIWYTNSVASP